MLLKNIASNITFFSVGPEAINTAENMVFLFYVNSSQK